MPAERSPGGDGGPPNDDAPTENRPHGPTIDRHVSPYADHDDPRVRSETLRELHGGDGEGRVVVVGAVHDHPASAYRAHAVVETETPDILALELPQIAVPLFERLTGVVSPSDAPATGAGGEMTAAIRAATAGSTASVVGIDGPSWRSVRALARSVHAASPPTTVLRDLAADWAGLTRHAVQCRLAATGAWGDLHGPVEPMAYDCTSGDSPARQAEHERTHLKKSRSFLGAFEQPAAMALSDGAREQAMAEALRSLRREGSVVAVVGFDHLDAIAERVENPS